MKPAIIVDFDGTLSNTKHREHFVLAKPKKWRDFFEAADKDPLQDWCREVITKFKADGFSIILVTGRPEWMRELSLTWLEKFQVPFDKLLMRQNEDHRDDPIIKWEIYEQFILLEYSVLFVLEDRDRVVKMWREKGLTCLQCADGNF